MATNRDLSAAPLRVLVAICEASVVRIGRLLSVIEEDINEHGHLAVILEASVYTKQYGLNTLRKVVVDPDSFRPAVAKPLEDISHPLGKMATSVERVVVSVYWDSA